MRNRAQNATELSAINANLLAIRLFQEQVADLAYMLKPAGVIVTIDDISKTIQRGTVRGMPILRYITFPPGEALSLLEVEFPLLLPFPMATHRPISRIFAAYHVWGLRPALSQRSVVARHNQKRLFGATSQVYGFAYGDSVGPGRRPIVRCAS